MPFEPLDQYTQRKKKLDEIKALGENPYPHRFEQSDSPAGIVAKYGERDAASLEAERIGVTTAGRILTLRLHGKAGFAHVQGAGGRVQIYVRLDVVGEQAFKLFRLLDMGDVVGVSGHLFRTKTNELTIAVQQISLLTKSLLPLPEKWHGLADVALRYRQRYLDLIVNPRVREIFVKRAELLRELRSFFDARGYLEVETPMMQTIPGGAAARPFITHHNTYDSDLYLRIAPELYLKRLVVGGLDRVYEINRNFRNEGINTNHNPEFTMLEFYQAYSDYRDLMNLTDELLARLALKICGSTVVTYGEHQLDFGNLRRLSMREAIGLYWPQGAGPAPSPEDLARPGGPLAAAESYNSWAINVAPDRAAAQSSEGPSAQSEDMPHELLGITALTDGELTGLLFEIVAEPKLIQPTLLYDFPTDISPLAKCREDDPSLVERFEIYVAGMELGNAFSELNDAEEQERRFREQVARGGDEVPREVDMDYIRALSHAMPPAAGMGIGIDRLIMLLTDSRSIREVILFPLLRPETEIAADITGQATVSGNPTDAGPSLETGDAS